MTNANVPIEKVVEILESAKLRKAMYFSPVTVEAADTWLGGFATACIACGVLGNWVDVHAARERRGWDVTRPTCPIPQMQAKGLTDEQIIEELFAILIDTVRQRAQV